MGACLNISFLSLPHPTLSNLGLEVEAGVLRAKSC
jgi:hypothetical protein